MSKKQKTVEIIASGYEWICPECETIVKEIEALLDVICPECNEIFEVTDVIHAMG